MRLVNPSKDGGVLRGSLGIPNWRTRRTEPIVRVEPLFMNVGSTSFYHYTCFAGRFLLRIVGRADRNYKSCTRAPKRDTVLTLPALFPPGGAVLERFLQRNGANSRSEFAPLCCSFPICPWFPTALRCQCKDPSRRPTTSPRSSRRFRSSRRDRPRPNWRSCRSGSAPPRLRPKSDRRD
jgi:hypothetical protein